MSNTKENFASNSKKLKVTAIVLNILYVIATIVFALMMYRWISANDYLALDYIGYKKLIVPAVALIVILMIALALKGGRKRYLASSIISGIMILVLLTGSVLEVVYHKKILNIFDKMDQTIDTIVEKSKLSTDEYGFYVLKDDSAQSIKDVIDYSFSYSDKCPKEDIETIKEAYLKEVNKELQPKGYDDPLEMVQEFLYQNNKEVLILNNSMIELIENAGDTDDDNSKKSGDYSKFSSMIRCIHTVSVKNAVKAKAVKKTVTDECFTVYISGIDVEGDVTTKSRSDVNIIMTVNPVTHQILLVSTPRDYYVPLSISGGSKDKLTHAGNYGIDVSIQTLEQLYGIKIDYFVRMNFTGFVNIIDALGGVDLKSDYTFYTHGCQFYEGMNPDVPGNRAIWFARERKSFADGDRQRGKNQMVVIEAVIKKCMSSTLLRRYDDIMRSVAESFQTNMGKKDIKKLVNFQIDEGIKWKIMQYSVSGYGTKATTYSVPNAYSYVMEPDVSTVDEAKSYMSSMKKNKKIKVKNKEEELQIKSAQ